MNTTHFLRAMTAIISLAVAVPATAQCTGDLTGNGIVDGADLGTILAYWGPRTQDPTSIASDLNGDRLINGADLGVLLNAWGPCPATITSITPNQGCIVGGTQITITGTYLGSTSTVTVGGTPAPSFTVVNQNTVQATTPPGAAGPANIWVTTAAGTITASQQFTYMPASVSGITPSSGVPAGGAQITITGAYLALTTGVTIGGSPCTNLTVVNSNTITVVTPPGSIGNADVVITGAKGTVTVPGGFRYVSIVVPPWAMLVEPQPDPAVVTDPVLRAAIVATGLAWRVRDGLTQIEMVLVPPGTFSMGCSPSNSYSCNSDESPVHAVSLTNAFYMGRFEVTQAQWTTRMGSNPSLNQAASAEVPTTEVPKRPVERVTWLSIQGFLSATGTRLPTEAEWEYACRAGSSTAFHSMPGNPAGTNDDNLLGNIAWYASNSVNQTRPVGLKAGNGFGLHDMLGNVFEWVDDWYAGNYYSQSPSANPTGPSTGSLRVLRGGSWDLNSGRCRSACRYQTFPSNNGNVFGGFRVARNP